MGEVSDETKEVLRNVYRIARTNTSAYAQYGICMRIIRAYPEVFAEYKVRPYHSIPEPPDE